MQVTIRNFQSIEHCSFEIPEKAFTCIVGPSNIGKSAIRRAIGCLLYNNSEASFIRRGTKECSVEVVFDDGTKVKWFRSEANSGSYEINGESFSKLNKTVPKPILEKGFKELMLSKDRVNVQTASQFEHIFLLGETGSKVTEVFSNLGNLNKIILANKACSADLKSSKSKLSVRKDDLLIAKEKLKSYRGLDEQVQFFGGLKEEILKLRETEKKYLSLNQLLRKLNRSVAVNKAIRPAKDIVLTPVEIDLNKVSLARKTLKKFEVSTAKNEKYAALKDVVEPKFDLGTEHERLLKVRSLYKSFDRAVKKTSAHSNIPTIPQMEEIDLTKIKKIRDIYGKLTKSKTDLLRLRSDSEKAEIEVKRLKEEEDKIHESLGGKCPLCGEIKGGKKNV